MTVSRTRAMKPEAALAVVKTELARHGLKAVTRRRGSGLAGVTECELQDRAGRVTVSTSGYGPGGQATASAVCEAWQWHWHQAGFAAARRDPQRVRVMAPEEIAAQDALAGTDHLAALIAREHPAARVAAIRYVSFSPPCPDEDVWYPACARFPWFPDYPVEGDGGYGTFAERYGTAVGTAAGMSESEATFHALIEAAEGDAMSLALLDWYAAPGGRQAPRRVHGENLPHASRALLRETAALLGSEPFLFDITADAGSGVPAFLAVPSRDARLGVCGEAAALSGARAAERALGELVQAHLWALDHPEHETLMQKRIRDLDGRPLLQECARLDPQDLARRAAPAGPRASSWWDGPPGDVEDQLACLTGMLARAGYRCWATRWTAPGSAVPVVSVLVPGMEVFFLSRKGVPVVPTGRGMARIGAGALPGGAAA